MFENSGVKKFEINENIVMIKAWENFQDMQLHRHTAARRGVCPVRRCGGRSVRPHRNSQFPHQWTLPNSPLYDVWITYHIVKFVYD